MHIEVESQGEVFSLESKTPLSINQILSKLEIPPSTVLAVYDGTILPHTSVIESDIRLELIIVSSGGWLNNIIQILINGKYYFALNI